MASILDQALDEIVGTGVNENDSNGPRARNRGLRRRGGGDRYDDRSSAPRDGPRDGISKPARNMRDPGRNTWQHDKYDEPEGNSYNRRDRVDRGVVAQGSARLRVENVHYDLGESDLMDVFSRVGQVLKLELMYDRAGRSEGVAIVTYSNEEEARIAISQFDGANANGQPIRVKFMPGGGGGYGGRGRGGHPNEGRSLFERIGNTNDGRLGMDRNMDRSASPARIRRDPEELREEARQLKIDRYVPGDRRSTSRDRRPRGGGGERERDRRGRGGGGRVRDDRRGDRGGGGRNLPRKTAEELDAEMNSYWGGAQEPVVTVGGAGSADPIVTVGGGGGGGGGVSAGDRAAQYRPSGPEDTSYVYTGPDDISPAMEA